MNILDDPLSVLALGLFNGFALCVFVLSLPPLRRPGRCPLGCSPVCEIRSR